MWGTVMKEDLDDKLADCYLHHAFKEMFDEQERKDKTI